MQRLMLAVCVIAIVFISGMSRLLTASQAPTRERVDVSKLGPQVGERVPDFSLTDQNGGARTLQSLMGARGLMLVFLRSADW